jgi:Flp pilus assembly protein TadG
MMRAFIYKNCPYLLSAVRGLNCRDAAPAPSACGFFGDRSGVVVVLVALAMPVLLGLTAFAVDVSQWSSTKNSIQAAADNSVLSAAVAAAQSGATSAQITNQALAVAAATGFANGQNGVTVTVNTPPTSGNYTSSAYTNSAYEVIIKQPQTRYFAVLLGAAPTVSGRAVMLAAGNPACVLALDGSASSAIGVNGSFNINAPNCTVAANSSSGTAVTLNGAGTLTASNLNVVGNYTKNGAVTINATIKTGAPATLDPYASLAVPSVGACSQPTLPAPYSLNGAGSVTINPGVYCGGISVNGAWTVTMNPGVYIINGGNFSLNGATTVTGSGVSIVLTNKPGGSGGWGNVTINGSTTVTLTPPTSGSMQGVAVYVDRNAPSGTDVFNGASNMKITGSVYAPSRNVSWNGATSTGSDCLQLIADKININGAASFGTSCGSLDVPGLRPPVGPNGKGVPAE